MLEKLWQYKKYWIPILLVVLTNLGTFFYAKYSIKPIVKEKIVEKVVEKIVEKKVEVKVKDTSINEDSHKEKIVYRYVNVQGKPVEIIVEKEGKERVVVKTEVQYKDRIVDRIVEKEKIVEKLTKPSLPNWQLSVSAGLNIPMALDEPKLGIEQLSPAVIGVGIQRRIWGPLKGGLTGDTMGTVGIILSGEW